MVNSEEGYQNLRRFLFGDTRIEASLVGHRLPDDDDLVWQAETRLSVRGLPVVMHERLAAHWCPVQLDPPTAGTGADDDSVPLAATFLNSRLRQTTGEPMRFILMLRLLSLRERRGILSLGDHIERTADFSDTLVIDVGTSLPGLRIPCGSRAALAAASTSKAGPSASATKRLRLSPTPWWCDSVPPPASAARVPASQAAR